MITLTLILFWICSCFKFF